MPESFFHFSARRIAEIVGIRKPYRKQMPRLDTSTLPIKQDLSWISEDLKDPKAMGDRANTTPYPLEQADDS